MVDKYDNASSFFDYFLKSPNLLVIDLDNVLVTKIPMSTENQNMIKENEEKYSEQLIVIEIQDENGEAVEGQDKIIY